MTFNYNTITIKYLQKKHTSNCYNPNGARCAVSNERSLRNYKQDGGTDTPKSSYRRQL